MLDPEPRPLCFLLVTFIDDGLAAPVPVDFVSVTLRMGVDTLDDLPFTDFYVVETFDPLYPEG